MNLRLLLYIFVSVALSACSGSIDIDGHIDASPDIYPDYAGVTVPPNIAPLNFHVKGAGDYGVVVSHGSVSWSVVADKGDIELPMGRWRQMLADAVGDSVCFTVCRRTDGKWQAYRPFYVHVAPDSIDRMLVYRLIPPLYGTWREMGIYQRDLESYDQSPVYENVANHGNCVNCHSFCDRDPSRMLFHMRGIGSATYLMHDGVRQRLNTKTDSTISNFTYPYWHPSGRYVAFSVNDIFQVFHSADPNRTEVIDDASDVVVYEVEACRAFSSPLIKDPARLETFPAFSPDGATLYFCSAARPDSLPEGYRDVHYSLCSIGFDAASGSFGSKVDTLFAAGLSRSVSLPRVSPDGRWIVATVSGYGNFSIWHKDADLWMCDLSTRQWVPMTAANSADVESYHSWSGNSRWLVFSSRRDDGYYTRPYIVHVAADGSVGKPFMLPQRSPHKYYAAQQCSFNIPEFVSAPVDLDSRSVAAWTASPTSQVAF